MKYHILYIHQYFKTPKEPGGTRSYWIAKELIKNGYKVTMLTSSNSILSKVEKKEIEGINVIYLKVPYNQKMSIFRRLLSFITFMLKSSIHAFRVKKVDVVFATSTPLTVGFPALILKKIKRKPFIFEVRDLWPEVPIQMGGLKNPVIKKIAVSFEKYIYKNAMHIIALSPGMQKGVLSKNITLKKTTMIPNMAKIDTFFPREKNYKLMNEMGLKKNSFKIIHFGSLGKANGAMTIIESAKLTNNSDNIEFIFIGGGALEQSLINKCKEYGINNVHFLGNFSMKLTSEIVNFCDVSIVSFLNLPILYTNSPNKLFDSLSAGKPIIVNSAGWTRDLVINNDCGFYVDPEKPSELTNLIHYLIKKPNIINEFSQNARILAKNNYDKSILCKSVVSVFKKNNF